MTAKIITITNQKGGVGKTATSWAFAAALKLKGFKVLSVDLDPQGNLSHAMRASNEYLDIYNAMAEKTPTIDVIQTTEQGDIIPSSKKLVGADRKFTELGREYIVRDLLQQVRSDYDYIIIDTPPALGILTTNALTASDTIIVPVEADISSVQGLSDLLDTVANIQRFSNPNINIEGLLITKFSPRTNLNRKLQDIYSKIAKEIGTKLFETWIRESVSFKESRANQTSIYDDSPLSKPALDYLEFVEEYLNGE